MGDLDGALAQVALVTDLKGKAESIAILSEIAANATVRLEGELTVLYYASGDEYRFKGPAVIAFAGDEPKRAAGRAAQRVAAEPKRMAALQPGGVAPATLRHAPEDLGRAARAHRGRAAGADAPFSKRVAFAAWLEQLGLKDEARVVLESARRRNGPIRSS